MDLDEDPFYIASWAEYAQFCKEQGKLSLFVGKLCQYIAITNKPVRDDIKAYCNRRLGEWARDELEAKYAKKFKEKE